ncbi:5-(carboxyamino)imidazole ribonucleotide synthase [Halomarina salina]|uniref:N5-carboxyaminoimidazole ribonucleotide synthase n=1 Tax=Halomarina salina TaxID=1872699 RepID=A0ABD5RIH9_9EURY|nr:5-(carboxyamino)imidazole ribonucleotide synthase [Halomarina salina]
MKLTTPGPTVGVVGGGQLARMLGEAAGPLGVGVVALDPTPDPPAAPVVGDTVAADFDDEEAVFSLADRVDVLTYEIELADADLLERVREETGTPVHPDPETLARTQDKLREKRWLDDAGVPVPEYRAVADEADLREAGEDLGWPVMLKAREGGYDGRGNLPVEGSDAAADALDELGSDALAEAMVPFERELSVIGVRGADGETATYPVTETVHEDEILRESVQPARTSDAVAERAREVATDVLDAMDGRGVFGIELFQVDEEILVNEIAPRPHNSGHWTIEGAHASQFEQHARSVLGWPLGSTERRGASVTTNLLGDVEEPGPAELSGVESVLDAPDAHLHWYGKREARPLRKMGHVTVVGDDADAALDRARDLRDAVTFR